MNYLPYGGSTYSKTAVADPSFDRLATHGDGWRIFDDKGNDYADYICGLGSVILGHRHPVVDEAIRRQLCSGTTLSLATAIEHEAAERLLKHFPAGSMVQWGVNGSDATEGACRLARLVTGKERIVVAREAYHGFHDWCLGNTERGCGIPSRMGWFAPRVGSPRQPGWFKQQVAAVIVEPDSHWLKDIRQWCTSHGALLIADEVMTYGRFPSYLACSHYGVSPDLSCLGKALANGMPASAIVGDKSILCRFAPPNPNAFFSSTWAGHPLSMAAVIATLDVLERENGPQKLWDKALEVLGIIAPIMNASPTFNDCECSCRPWNRITFKSRRTARVWRRLMLEHGVLIYAAHNLSLAHDANAMTRLCEAWKNSVRLLPERLDAMPESEEKEHSIMRR